MFWSLQKLPLPVHVAFDHLGDDHWGIVDVDDVAVTFIVPTGENTNPRVFCEKCGDSHS
jgi:hypothetical protein